jgi:HK97 family phage prohead protease
MYNDAGIMEEGMETISKTYDVTGIDDEIIMVCASKQVVDRDGDLIMVDGIATENFMKNPVVLKCHDMYEYPIGKVEVLAKGVDSTGTPELVAGIRFADTDDGREAFYLFKNGFLNAVSIRFQPTEMESKDFEKDGMRYKIMGSELLEISAVAIPANQAALIKKTLELETTIKGMQSKQTTDMETIIKRIEALSKTLSTAGPVIEQDGKAIKGIYDRIYSLNKKIKGEH